MLALSAMLVTLLVTNIYENAVPRAYLISKTSLCFVIYAKHFLKKTCSIGQKKIKEKKMDPHASLKFYSNVKTQISKWLNVVY